MSQTNKGSLIVLSGFSGAGKGTIVKSLLEKYPNYILSISCTTRKPREGEVDGREYFFITEEAFTEKIEKDELLEHARYVDCSYGTPRDFVEKMRNAGRDVILEIEAQGAAIIRMKCPDAILVFIMTPSAQELEKRLTERGTDSPEKIAKRLKRAEEEIKCIPDYDAVIVNDDLDRAVEDVHQAIRVLGWRPCSRQKLIRSFAEGLSGINGKRA